MVEGARAEKKRRLSRRYNGGEKSTLEEGNTVWTSRTGNGKKPERARRTGIKRVSPSSEFGQGKRRGQESATEKAIRKERKEEE